MCRPRLPSNSRSTSGLKATASTASSTPSSRKARVAFGPSWMPAPVSSANTERSSSVALMPCPRKRDRRGESANAAANDEHAALRPGLRHRLRAQASGAPGGAVATKTQLGGSLSVCVEGRIVVEQGRAIRADELGLIAHIEIDMGMVERRRRAHALEFLDADPDTVDALVVHEMRHQRLSHGSCVLCL